MALDISEIGSILHGLIETCRDGEKGFTKAAEKLKHPEIRTLFDNYSRVRGQFARELEAAAARTGVPAAQSGIAALTIQRGWTALKAALIENDDHPILEVAEHGEDAAVKNYRDALYKELPDDLHKLIERQYREIRQTHKNVRALRDSGWPTMYAPMAGLV
jgi:uncharacterized protein (TIGR02284 family)